ncbi:MAG TPA: glycoside hydrolase [Nitrospiraceae bacterium]|nr:glycoside hydrolase [Nitrospiraceae bacterium]
MQTTEPQFIKKELVRSRNVYKVTFQLPGAVAPKARKVTIVGEFNNWDRQATPLKKMANGDFVVTLELDAGKEYRFRYLIDGNRWENDWHADKYVKGPYGDDDSVVCVSPV